MKNINRRKLIKTYLLLLFISCFLSAPWVISYGAEQSAALTNQINLSLYSFEEPLYEDVNGDNRKETLELTRNSTGVTLCITFSDREPVNITYDGAFLPRCDLTLCDLGTGAYSLLAQVPVTGAEDNYWAKCFINQNNTYTETAIPDLLFNGYFLDDYTFKVFCDNNDFQVDLTYDLERNMKGEAVFGDIPLRYEAVYHSALGKYVISINQTLFPAKYPSEAIGAIKSAISYCENGWKIETQTGSF